MPETSRNVHNYITLKEYIDTRLAAIDKATDLAYKAMNERLMGMNEFRDALKDQSAKFVTSEELDAKIAVLCANIKSLELSRANLEGRASQTSVYIAYGISILGIIIGIISLLR